MNHIGCLLIMDKSRYLVTRWFGTFLYENKNIIDSRIFPKDHLQLQKYLDCFMKQKILDEERQFLIKGNVTISEKRLKSFGKYQPENPFFNSIDLDAKSFGFSESILQQSMVHLTEHTVEDALSLPDCQVIQMVKTVDDLLQTANLFSERLCYWKIFPTNNHTIQPFEQLLISVSAEISRLETEIEHQILILAPNVCSLIGPLLTARLVTCAGSLEKLAKLPASSIQLLGAEKALFRFKKEGGKPPKHGVLFQHLLINTAPKKNRGKFARILSSKIAIAAKADAFTKRDISLNLLASFERKINEIKKSTNV